MNIVPKEIVRTEVASRVDVQVMRLELFKQADLHVTVLSSDGRIIHSQPLTLQGDDYKAWSSDDSYLYKYVANKLGYTVAPASAPTPVAASAPVAEPTPAPAAEPTPAPVAEPSPAPVAEPSPAPVAEPTPAPAPVAEPTPTPTNEVIEPVDPTTQ